MVENGRGKECVCVCVSVCVLCVCVCVQVRVCAYGGRGNLEPSLPFISLLHSRLTDSLPLSLFHFITNSPPLYSSSFHFHFHFHFHFQVLKDTLSRAMYGNTIFGESKPNCIILGTSFSDSILSLIVTFPSVYDIFVF